MKLNGLGISVVRTFYLSQSCIKKRKEKKSSIIPAGQCNCFSLAWHDHTLEANVRSYVIMWLWFLFFFPPRQIVVLGGSVVRFVGSNHCRAGKIIVLYFIPIKMPTSPLFSRRVAEKKQNKTNPYTVNIHIICRLLKMYASVNSAQNNTSHIVNRRRNKHL